MQTTKSTQSPLVVGLTGSIGSGKSAASSIFAALGAIVIDADILAREVVVPKSAALGAIAAKFGPSVVSLDGTLNRSELGKIVFNSADCRKELEAIVHPKVRKLYLIRLGEALKKVPSMVVYAVPLLFESKNSYEEIDYVVVVNCPKQIAIERIIARDKLTKDEAIRRYDSQIPIEDKVKKADFVIDNSNGISQLESEVQRVYAELLAKGAKL